MLQIMLIEDDMMMAECIARALKARGNYDIECFSNALMAMESIDRNLPDVILLDIMLSGPDGFSFLNELVSYTDTAHIPVIIITSLNLEKIDLSHYNVKKVLQKETMTPAEIRLSVEEVCTDAK